MTLNTETLNLKTNQFFLPLLCFLIALWVLAPYINELQNETTINLQERKLFKILMGKDLLPCSRPYFFQLIGPVETISMAYVCRTGRNLITWWPWPYNIVLACMMRG